MTMLHIHSHSHCVVVIKGAGLHDVRVDMGALTRLAAPVLPAEAPRLKAWHARWTCSAASDR